MAFSAQGGYTNLPNGNWSPTIFSRKAQKAFRKTSVVQDITNTDYTGEIAAYGDSVRIIKEPNITVNPLLRGTPVAIQSLDDADFTMIVDQANYFAFALDDIEKAHSHVNFMELATDKAGYEMTDTFDREVLAHMAGFEDDGAGGFQVRTAASGTKAIAAADNDELLAANKLDITDFGGSEITATKTSIPVAPGGGAGAITSLLSVINRMKRKMDMANIPTEGRWIVLDPIAMEVLGDEDSKLINADWGGEGEVRNGRLPSKIRGFRVYQSNNLPYIGDGADTAASAGSITNYNVIVAGHDSSVATAEQLSKTSRYESETYFAEVVRGMHLYARKILRPEGLITAYWNLA